MIIQSKIIEVKTLGNQTIVPVAGDIVTARVTVINQRFAKCAIICIGDVILKRVYRALIRKEDVRAERKDEVDMYKSFRPGDIILARIVSDFQTHTYTHSLQHSLFDLKFINELLVSL